MRVFVSSTYLDLQQERQAVIEILQKAQFEARSIDATVGSEEPFRRVVTSFPSKASEILSGRVKQSPIQ